MKYLFDFKVEYPLYNKYVTGRKNVKKKKKKPLVTLTRITNYLVGQTKLSFMNATNRCKSKKKKKFYI